MEKVILWIDDREIVMEEVVSYMFGEFFDNDIKPLIFIIDNDDKTMSDNNKISTLNQVIYDKFVSYIVDNNIYDDDNIEKKEKLVKTSSNDLATADVASFKEYYQTYKNQIENLRELNIRNDVNITQKNQLSTESEKNNDDYRMTKETLKSFDGLVNSIITDSGVNTDNIIPYIAIDLCLMKNDHYNLMSETSYPILSMVLYKLFKEKFSEKVFLYSSFVSPTKTVRSWINIYRKTIGDSNEDIIVYDRKGDSVQIEREAKSIKMINKIMEEKND